MLLGAAVFNLLLFLFLAIVMMTVTGTMLHIFKVQPHHVFARTRFPGMMQVFYLFLLQGTSYAAFRLLWIGAVGSKVVGVVVVGLCIASVACLWRMTRGAALGRQAMTIADPVLVCDANATTEVGRRGLTGWLRRAYVFAFGEQAWVSLPPPRGCYYNDRFGITYEHLEGDRVWFMTSTAACVIVLSAAASWRPEYGVWCDVRNVIVCLYFAAMLLQSAIYMPFMGRLHNMYGLVALGLMLSAMCVLTAMMWQVSTDLADTAAELLFYAGRIFTAKAVVDLLLWAYTMKTDRRRILALAVAEVAEEEHVRSHQLLAEGSVVAADDELLSSTLLNESEAESASQPNRSLSEAPNVLSGSRRSLGASVSPLLPPSPPSWSPRRRKGDEETPTTPVVALPHALRRRDDLSPAALPRRPPSCSRPRTEDILDACTPKSTTPGSPELAVARMRTLSGRGNRVRARVRRLTRDGTRALEEGEGNVAVFQESQPAPTPRGLGRGRGSQLRARSESPANPLETRR
eukprot:TRINITY_DN17302_c0_g1_i1.p1 TRINITY_DN17302_c0_g1~~TRINITY_DN17302_c0_g1_i1.p1  ORF type:complete len:517 (+),score=49.19 TRINITY_DN17302_c0_g1_i1:796-2346(+)